MNLGFSPTMMTRGNSGGDGPLGQVGLGEIVEMIV